MIIMKICLIYPPNSLLESEIPLGLLSIASFLSHKGAFDVSVVDVSPLIYNGTIEKNPKIYENIAAFLVKNIDADVYGFSTLSTLEVAALQISKCIKRLKKESVIVFGNQWATDNDRQILKNFDSVDCIVRGEGEISFYEYLNAMKHKGNLKSVLGITYRNNNKIIKNADRPLIPNLDSLPPLDYSLLYFGLKDYRKRRNRDVDCAGLIEYGRGCSYKCNFCSTSAFWNRTARVYSPKRIIAEIKALKSQGYGFFKFAYDNFGTFEKHCHQFMADLYTEFMGNIQWSVRCRVDCLNDETISLMAKAGCISMLIGAESGSNSVLKKMNKLITVEQIASKISKIVESGISPIVSLMTGFDYEDEKSVFETMRFACELSLLSHFSSVTIHFMAPLAGTKVTKKALKEEKLIFSKNTLISPDFAQYLEWGDNSSSVDHRPVRLKSDQLLLRKHPALFCSFAYIKNQHLDPEVFASLSTYYNVLLDHYPITVLYLLEMFPENSIELISSLEGFFKKHSFTLEMLWNLRVFTDSIDYALQDLFFNIFRKYIEKYSADMVLKDIYEYEEMVLVARLHLDKQYIAACETFKKKSFLDEGISRGSSREFGCAVVGFIDDIKKSVPERNHRNWLNKHLKYKMKKNYSIKLKEELDLYTLDISEG